MTGSDFSTVDQHLRAKLAIEQQILGHALPPFGLDKLSTEEVASYAGLATETLRQTSKRRALRLPDPYAIGRRLFWRRSEIDAWIEEQRRKTGQVHGGANPNGAPQAGQGSAP
jgi:predicted DNA-binding transcriptional regulator AlpA